MELPGIVGMLSFLSGFVLAVPMAIVGFEFLARGRMAFGVVFLGLAVALVFLPEFILRRIPGPREIVAEKISGFRRD